MNSQRCTLKKLVIQAEDILMIFKQMWANIASVSMDWTYEL